MKLNLDSHFCPTDTFGEGLYIRGPLLTLKTQISSNQNLSLEMLSDSP
jgi:hypothetical protein